MSLTGNIWANNSRFLYYLKHILEFTIPARFAANSVKHLIKESDPALLQKLERRTSYYNQIDSTFSVSQEASPFSLQLFRRQRNYQIDLFKYTRLFPKHMRIDKIFGDTNTIPKRPTILKARPILTEGIQNGILMPLNKIRHFKFPRDPYTYENKMDKLVWRGAALQANRKAFLNQFFAHPQCDVGHYSKSRSQSAWRKGFLSIHEQLRCKFILSLEGNDVATNLKWILNSNSLCFMPTPRSETWFMEGQLEPGTHFVSIRDDYSDLEEKLEYYISNPNAALEIITKAQAHVRQFQDPTIEDAVAYSVLLKYFTLSGQI